jgi:hypothetical protein
MRNLDNSRRQLGALEVVPGGVEIVLGIDAQPDALAQGGFRTLLENQAVMAGLLDAAQIESLSLLIADRKAQRIAIESATGAQILDGQDHMARPRGVERRRIGGSGYRHGALVLRPRPYARRMPTIHHQPHREFTPRVHSLAP